VDVSGLDIIGKVLVAVAAFVSGVVTGTWTVSAKMHQLADHEKRLARLERCIETKLDRLHERIDDLMVMVGADPAKFRHEHRQDRDDAPDKRDYYG
jgi:CHASE1-domain containing sensor protein